MRTMSVWGCIAAAVAGAVLSCADVTDDPGRGATGGAALQSAAVSVAERREAPTLPQARKKWTLLVYMAADNNLSPFSSGDIAEMAKKGSDANVNIVVMWDNDPRQEGQGAQNRHGYYYVTTGGASCVKDIGEVNTGDPKTARQFIDYAVQNFPAERYLWVFWNHGGAVDRVRRLSTRGVAWDDTGGGDHLSELEQREIMLHLAERIGKKVDIVGFDACLMATAEIAYQYRDVASYLVASEQTIPGQGWDYRFIETIAAKPTITPLALTRQIVAYYKAFYTKAAERDVTLSVYNLAQAQRLGTLLDDFAGAAMASGVPRSAFRNCANGLPVFGLYEDDGRECYYTRDLYAYLDRVCAVKGLPAAVRGKAESVMALIDDVKFMAEEWHGSGWRGAAHGIAITLKRATSVYRKLDLCRDGRWDEFLNWAAFPDGDEVP